MITQHSLYHKDKLIATFCLNNNEVTKLAIYKSNIDLLPLPLKRIIRYKNEFIDNNMPESLNKDFYFGNDEGCWLFEDWLSDRQLPVNRDNLNKYLSRGKSAREWMLENNAFSFVDCYWIENNNEKLTWNDIKVKMEDVDEFLFAKSEDKFYKGINSTLGGELEKFWFKKNNQLYLCKKVAKNFDILNAREVIASLIYEKQGYSNACHYNFITDKEDEVIGCTCKAFTNENIELITAYDLLEEYNMTQQNDVYERIIDYAVKYGCNEDDARNYMDIQTIVDYLINNRDRHQGNIGFLRDSSTLQIIKPAPIYDSGSSKHLEGEKPESVEYTKVNGLYSTEIKCLSHIKNWDIIDIDKLPTTTEIKDILDKCIYISDIRKNTLLNLYDKKCDYIKEKQLEYHKNIRNEINYECK